jgi:tetratricopeptide (TPR) repeat protein
VYILHALIAVSESTELTQLHSRQFWARPQQYQYQLYILTKLHTCKLLSLIATRTATIQVYELGIRADPGHAALYCSYGVMEAKLGNYTKARDLYERGLQVDPFHAQVGNTTTAYTVHMIAVQ